MMIFIYELCNPQHDEQQYLPKMEEHHKAKCKESHQHSIYQPLVHNFTSKPRAPYITDCLQSLTTSPLNDKGKELKEAINIYSNINTTKI